ncbi:hypothetical protein ACFFIO_09035 [Citricoccus parietis]|uniref:Uncharacterized protein n=1 Tax=Citricoccus parietis TaxID=592307 RepID=A0ABV6F6C7_9MICC
MVRVIVTAVAAVLAVTVMTAGLPMTAVLALRLLAMIMTGVLIE